MTKSSQEDYYKSLPTKRMGTGVLFFNVKGELLIVKPNYKEGWSIPGGVIDANESPRAAGFRETKEEIGIDIDEVQFLCVCYSLNDWPKTESLQFVFNG